jgi:RNA polymerase sigma factor (sigma-70 family)
MPAAQLEPVVRFIRDCVHHAQLSDAQLLTRFAADRDEGAFSALIRRHGPLVFGVCRRALRDTHAAEDAFQATFLLLARKASSLACPERLSNWLYGVACRVAARARAREARRRSCESKAPMPAPTMPDQAADWRDLRAVLDEEINRLPTRQRDAVVLCYLEGQTNARAATLLGCPRGSVATLLARARRRLRQRLAGRELAVPAVLACTWLAQQAEATIMPASLTCSTVEAAMQCAAGGLQAAGLVSSPAVALAKGVVRDMFWKKLTVTIAFLLVLVTLAGAGASLTGRTALARQPAAQSAGPRNLPLSKALRRSLKHAGFRVHEGGGVLRISLPGADALNAERIAAQRLLNTEVAYWNLYGGYWTLYSREQGLRFAHETFRLSKLRYEAGQVKASEFHQARGQYELFRAQRGQAISSVLEFERQLRNLMGMGIEDGTLFVPSDAPTLALCHPDWNAALNEALSKRPELRMTRQEIKAAQMKLTLAKNQVLPDLRFTAAYDCKSLGTRLDGADLGLTGTDINAFGSLAQMHYSDWMVGFCLASVQIRQAQLTLARAMETLKNQELKTRRFLDRQCEQISFAHKQIGGYRDQRVAFGELLRARNEEYKAGRGTLDILLETQRFWADALSSEYAAIATYNNALASFEFAKGAALKRHKISMEEIRSRGPAQPAVRRP